MIAAHQITEIEYKIMLKGKTLKQTMDKKLFITNNGHQTFTE